MLQKPRILILPALLALLASPVFAAPWQAADDLAKRLISAKPGAERDTLLDTEKASLTPALTKTLILEGERFSEQQLWEKSLDAYKLAQRIAIEIQDRA